MACGSCRKNAERVIEQKPKIVVVDRKNAQNKKNKKIAPNIDKKVKLFM